jgi:DNA-binding XRE family transcriptional regulator
MTDNQIVNANIKAFRLILGRNQGEFAVWLGVAESAISQIENGKRQPSADLITKLVSRCGITPNQIYADDFLGPVRSMAREGS